ncbi:hypothetical protein LSTR_LSTR009677 [Laodelphax striatellus]|uniref:SCP domain-containing protein n=1 Tax=Laodelphax striatellus TaxID=195883 RepID=A0A482WNC6_LAOST|nr:hypothetical protein LSTR_LSTR009677 [Laodelphax striatellus]
MVFMYSCLLFPILTVSMSMLVCRACKDGQIYDNTVTEEDITGVVEAHNLYRSTVALGKLENQPPAQNMQEMSWDDELAKTAQNYANQCVFKHNKDRGEGVGENLFIKMYGGPHTEREHNFTEAIMSWYDEHVHYKYKTVAQEDFHVRDLRTQTGHYTQVVWANTNKVGCGFASYSKTEEQRDELIYVCNYAPAGNFLGEYPYKEGEPDCKANGMSNSDLDGLCKK